MAWAGYSMGGNMVLKAAGEYGDSAPGWLRAVGRESRRCSICNRRQTRCTMRAIAYTNGIFYTICWRAIAAKRSCSPDAFHSQTATVFTASAPMTNTSLPPTAVFWERMITTTALRRREFLIASLYRR